MVVDFLGGEAKEGIVVVHGFTNSTPDKGMIQNLEASGVYSFNSQVTTLPCIMTVSLHPPRLLEFFTFMPKQCSGHV